jgi:phage gp29-like protein
VSFFDAARALITGVLPEEARARVASLFAVDMPRVALDAVTRLAGRPRAGGPIVPDVPLYAQLQRIGSGLTPEQVSAAIRAADGGRMSGLIDLANEAKQKDLHLQSIAATSEEAISGLPWELVLPDKPKLKERKAAERIEACLRGHRELPRVFGHHAGAVYYSYAVSEVVWKRDAGWLVPADFVAVSQRRFLFHPDTGKLCWFDANSGMAYPGVDIRATYPDKFIISQPRVNGDIPCREGLIRPMLWAALFRNWSLADWLKLGEIAWKPWRTVQYNKANEGDVDELIAVLEAMTASGVAALPDTAKLDIAWPKNSATGTSMHHELFSTVGQEMSKGFLGQTLTSEQTRVGSQALGNVHNEVRKDLRESRAASVANDFSRDVVDPMIRMNAGPGIRPPALRFITDDAVDVVAFAKGIKTLVEAGTRIPAIWVRDQAGIPEPADGEEVLGETNDDDDKTEATPPTEPEPGDDGGDAEDEPDEDADERAAA